MILQFVLYIRLRLYSGVTIAVMVYKLNDDAVQDIESQYLLHTIHDHHFQAIFTYSSTSAHSVSGLSSAAKCPPLS